MTAFPYSGGRYATECERNWEHYGDPHERPDSTGDVMVRTWTCCPDVEVLGEIFDCDTCGGPGVTPKDADLPPGWVEDTNGQHCERCQP